MKKCPYCAEMIQEEAVKCRYCGEFLDGSGSRRMMAQMRGLWGYEYRSSTTVFGFPLVHIAYGVDPETGRMRVAKGIIAVGNIAVGLLAMGGLAAGGIAIGGLVVGALALGGMAIGGIACGGMALGVWLALGGIAIAGSYAIGGLALAPQSISGAGADPELLEMLRRWFGRHVLRGLG